MVLDLATLARAFLSVDGCQFIVIEEGNKRKVSYLIILSLSLHAKSLKSDTHSIYVYNTSQFGRATFPAVHRHIWPVETVLEIMALK